MIIVFQLLVSTIDFRYITDAITPDEALAMLKAAVPEKMDRIEDLLKDGYPCYTTQVGKYSPPNHTPGIDSINTVYRCGVKGWMGYSDERVRQLCREYLAQGFDAFKLKVGRDLEGDRKRCALVREEIGWKNKLVSDRLSPKLLQINVNGLSPAIAPDGRRQSDLGRQRGHRLDETIDGIQVALDRRANIA